MKTPYISNLKDNVPAAALLIAMFIAIVGAAFTSNEARADQAITQMDTQQMDTIVIEAPRMQVTHLDTIVVTAQR